MISFDEFNKKRELKQVWIVSFVTGCLYIASALLNIFASVEKVDIQILLFNFIVVPAILFTVSYATYKNLHTNLISKLYTISPIVAMIGNMYFVINYEYMSVYQPEIYLIIVWTFTISGFKFRDSIFSGTLILIMAILVSSFFYELSVRELYLHIFWLLSAFSLGMVGRYILHLAFKDIYEKQIELELALQNKDILMREVYHRVKNNLQVISSLIKLDSKKIDNANAKEIFLQNRQRILSISLIHEQLYQQENLEKISLEVFLQQLINEFKHIRSDVAFTSKCEQISIKLDTAIHLGLVINEIITNSLKYAFVDNAKKNTINILIKEESYKLVIMIEDNGTGANTKEMEQSFGFELIRSLIQRQLKGTYAFRSDRGYSYLIKLDKY